MHGNMNVKYIHPLSPTLTAIFFHLPLFYSVANKTIFH